MRYRDLPHLLGPWIVAFGATPSESLAASFEWLPSLPDYGYASAEEISGDGATAVGECSVGPESGMSEACRWGAATGWQGLGFLPDHDISAAAGVSGNGGVVVGNAFSTATLENQAFRWTEADGMTGLGFLPGTDASLAAAVSADGNVVAGLSGNVPFRWTHGDGMVGLGLLPGYPYIWIAGISANGAVVVGEAYGEWPSPREAVRWTQADGMQGLGYLPAPFDFWSDARAASADGSVVVGSSTRFDGDWIYGQAVVWRQSCDCMQALGFLNGGVSSGASDVSADGTVIVGSSGERAQDGSYGFHAVVWTADGGLQKLTAILEGLGVDIPSSLYSADNVSADGDWILGHAYVEEDGQLVRKSFRAYVGTDDIGTGGPGELGFDSTAQSVYEGEQWAVRVERTAGSSGEVSVGYEFHEGTASSGQDFSPREGRLTWGDGETASKLIGFFLPDDSLEEGSETFTIVLGEPAGGARIVRGVVTVRIQASDGTGEPPPPPSNGGGGGFLGVGWLTLLVFLSSFGVRNQRDRAPGVPRGTRPCGDTGQRTVSRRCRAINASQLGPGKYQANIRDLSGLQELVRDSMHGHPKLENGGKTMSKFRHMTSAVALAALAWAGSAVADAVTDWNDIANNTVAVGRPGPIGSQDIALVQLAVHDAGKSGLAAVDQYAALPGLHIGRQQRDRRDDEIARDLLRPGRHLDPDDLKCAGRGQENPLVPEFLGSL